MTLKNFKNMSIFVVNKRICIYRSLTKLRSHYSDTEVYWVLRLLKTSSH